jgi:SAM-dependent methyltransferase
VTYFDRVIATDASDAQIRSAQPIDGVTFRVARAESSNLPAASVDLVTVAQALHWFDVAAFFREVERVLAPGGVLAFWCYQHCELDDDRVMAALARLLAAVDDFWPAERAIVESEYPDLETPFMDLPAGRFAMSVDWTADQLLAYTGTWSATKRYLADRGQDPVAIHADEIRGTWGHQRRTVTWPIILRACRKAET